MTEEERETIVNEALRLFVDYVNAWYNAYEPNADEHDPYTIESYTVTDPERSLYGECNWRVLEDLERGPDKPYFQEGLLKIECTDGDEGGPSSLYVGLSMHNHDSTDKPWIEWIVHIFDLQPCYIYSNEEGMRMPPEGEMKK